MAVLQLSTNFFLPALAQTVCFFIFAIALPENPLPIIPVNLTVEEPGILDGKYHFATE